MILAGSARMLSGYAGASASTASHCLTAGQLRLSLGARSPGLRAAQANRRSNLAASSNPREFVEPPGSRNNGDPGATSSTTGDEVAPPKTGPCATEEQLDDLQRDLNQLRKALGTQTAASQQQLLWITSLERQASGRPKSLPRTNMPRGMASS
jgi:hypothetical protein